MIWQFCSSVVHECSSRSLISNFFSPPIWFQYFCFCSVFLLWKICVHIHIWVYWDFLIPSGTLMHFYLFFFCLLGQLMQLKLGRWSITFVMLIKAMLLLKLCRFYVEFSNIKTKRQRCVGITDECTILDKTEFFFLKLFNFN